MGESIRKLQETLGVTACGLEASCFVAGTPVHAATGPAAIETLTPLRRVIGYVEGDRPADMGVARPMDFDPAQHRLLRLTLACASGRKVDITLVRSQQWLEENRRDGDTLLLEMPEMGVKGYARLTAVESCPPAEEGSGCLITGTFRHTSAQVYELKLAAENKPIGVTQPTRSGLVIAMHGCLRPTCESARYSQP